MSFRTRHGALIIGISEAMCQDQLPEFHDMNTSHSGALSKDEVIQAYRKTFSNSPDAVPSTGVAVACSKKTRTPRSPRPLWNLL